MTHLGFLKYMIKPKIIKNKVSIIINKLNFYNVISLYSEIP